MAYTIEQWESRIKEAGAGRYDFVRWSVDGEYGALKKCVVRCVIDGFEFEVRVSHLTGSGVGCHCCSKKRRWTSNERIDQINSLQGIKFVSWVDCHKNVRSKANVRCEVDGFVWSSKIDNLVNNKQGCPQCANQRRWTADERIEQINKIENIQFVSWCGGFSGSSSLAKVRCKIDGHEWKARVHNLVNNGRGCPKCAKTGYDKSKDGVLYAMRSECGRYVKVGITGNIQRRLYELSIRTPFRFNMIEKVCGDGGRVYDIEKHFHDKYERAGLSGFDGCTEWLVCSDELLSELRGLSIEHE
ncbi:MAG: zinc-ribbon domain-containing protein [Plesiomonas sp.]